MQSLVHSSECNGVTPYAISIPGRGRTCNLSASEADERARCGTTKQGNFARSGNPLDQSLDRLDENASRKRVEGGGRKARKAKPTTAIPDDDDNRRQPPTDFAQQVAGIMALPLTDAEKTDCIRRLLAAQTKGC